MKNKKSSMWGKFINSFDNTKNGFSARKLSAFIAVLTSIYATYKFVDTTTVVHSLMVWLTFALLCLGIITVEQILKFKGNIENKEDNESIVNDDNSVI